MTPPLVVDDRLGIAFREIMSGSVRRGNGAKEEPFAFDLEIQVPRVRRFRQVRPYVATIAGGTITWGEHIAEVQPGTVELFGATNATRTRKFFEFRFDFPLPDGTMVHAAGRKELHDDAGLDSIQDLATVFLTIHQQQVPIASGIVRVHITEFLRQWDTITVTGTPAPSIEETKAARTLFFGFMNTELREVYKEIPELFRDDQALSRTERDTLELLVKVLLPDPLPADGPTFTDIVDSLNGFLRDASERQIDDLRRGLRVIGIIAPLLQHKVPKLRQLVQRTMSSRKRSDLRDLFDAFHALIALPYYSHARADALVGYHRPVLGMVPVRPGAGRLTVLSTPPAQVFDVVIIGSGPGGSLLAARAAAAGKSVLVLEAGPYLHEEAIAPEELPAIARSYKHAGFQVANEGNPRLGPPVRILQGFAVGGGGLVNNAVCLPLPDARFQAWQSAGFPISRAELDASYDTVAAELGIQALSAAMDPAQVARRNPAGRFLEGAFGPVKVADVRRPVPPGLYECPVNLSDCQGLGLCNVGCFSARKNNPLQVYLPKAQADGAVIVERASVRSLETAVQGGVHRVTHAQVRLHDGRLVKVEGREFVLGAGPIGSTAVMLRSERLAAALTKAKAPVGRRFSANLGSPVFAFCDHVVHTGPSVQIAHYWMPDTVPATGFVIETWFNPPAANALAMPGYLDDHARRMRRYASTIAAAPLVGTRPAGRVYLRGGKVAIELPVGQPELRGLRMGLTMLARAFLHPANGSQVETIAVGLDEGLEFAGAVNVDALDQELERIESDPAQAFRLRFGTGHPQGGNALSADPALAVVEPSFLVRGTANLRVCDGSLFPDVAGVNPQWTILALADRCAMAMGL